MALTPQQREGARQYHTKAKTIEENVEKHLVPVCVVKTDNYRSYFGLYKKSLEAYPTGWRG